MNYGRAYRGFMGSNTYRKIKIYFILYICFLLMVSVSVILMPFGVGSETENGLPVFVSGGLFWVGLIGVAATAIIINKSRKSDLGFNEKYPRLKRLGITHFFKNKPAEIADILMFVSFIGFTVLRLFTDSFVLQFIIIALFVFAFGMHCMLNGINYIYINYCLRREKAL